MNLPHKSRGAFSILAAALFPVLIISIVLTLDTGRLYWEGQELQRIADLAALDAAQGSSTLISYSKNKPANNTSLNAELSTLAEQSKEQNLPKSDWNVTTVAQQRGMHTNSSGIREACALDAATATPEVPACSAGASYNIVEVVASKTVCLSSIANLKALFPDSNYSAPSATDSCLTPGFTMSRTAYASRPVYVAFSAGTTLLTLSSTKSPLLSSLLSGLGLTQSEIEAFIVSSNGLATTTISMEQLLAGVNADLSAGTFDAILDETEVTVSSLATASISALKSSDDPRVETALSILATSLANKLHVPLPLRGEGGVLYAPSGLNEKGALASRLSIGSLLSTALFLSNETSFIDLNIESHSPLDVSLKVIQPPRIAIGPVGCLANNPPPCIDSDGNTTWITTATPSQIDIAVDLKKPINLLNLVTLDELHLSISAVNGRAGINSLKITGDSHEVFIGGKTQPMDISSIDVKVTLLNNLPKATLLGVLGRVIGSAELSLSSSGVRKVASADPIAAYDEAVISHWAKCLPGPALQQCRKANTVTLESTAATAILHSLDTLPQLEISFETKTTSLLGGILEGLGLSNLLDDLFHGITQVLPISPTSKNMNGLITELNASLLPQVLHELIDPVVSPLLSDLGIGVNTMDVEILDVQAGSAQLIR